MEPMIQPVRVSYMEKRQNDSRGLPGTVSPEAQPMRWIAPLQSMTTFSITEFTRANTKPGDDGSGILTQS